MAAMGFGQGRNAMKRFFLGLVLIAFATAITAPAFAQSAKCLAFCTQTCAGKGNYCQIHWQQVAKACNK
jgi:hypothetical protein